MTLIVGVVKNNEVWIGGDSYMEINQISQTTARPKVFRKFEPQSGRPVLIGQCGDAMLGQIAEFQFDVLERPEGGDIFRHVCDGIAQPLLNAINARAESLKLKGKDWPRGRFLIGYEGRLFIIDRQFYVSETTGEFNSIGAGEDAALGCLFATKRLAPTARAQKALEAAAKYSSLVAPPFHIEKL